MIKRYNDFVNEENQNFEPITIKSKKNDSFFIKIHFDDKGRVDKIENKWDVNIPNWIGLKLNQTEVNNWISKRPEFYIDKIEKVNEEFVPFYGDIQNELKKLLQNTVWKEVDAVDTRVEQLLSMHRKFIDFAMDRLTAEEIAQKLYKYDKNAYENR